MKSHHLYKFAILAFFVTAACFLLCSCKMEKGEVKESMDLSYGESHVSKESGNTSAEYDITTSNVITYPIPEENVYIANTHNYRCPSSMGGYYFCNTKHLRYQTVGSQNSTPLCLQPGCKHSDESCEAFMGGIIEEMAEYKGKLYAKVRTENESIEIVSFDLDNRERKTIRHWEFEFETDTGGIVQTFVHLNNIAYDGLYYTYSRTVYDPVNQEVQDSVNETVRYDLVTGEECQMSFVFACMGASGYAGKDTNSVTDEQSGEDVLSEAYIWVRDPKTLELHKLVDYEQDNYQPTRDPAYCYGSFISYQCDNTLYCFNVDTGESKELVTPDEPIINYWLMDRKIFYITRNADDVSCFWYADLDNPVPVRLRNDDNTDNMVFSITYEGTDFFADNNNIVISKEDFYAQNET